MVSHENRNILRVFLLIGTIILLVVCTACVGFGIFLFNGSYTSHLKYKIEYQRALEEFNRGLREFRPIQISRPDIFFSLALGIALLLFALYGYIMSILGLIGAAKRNRRCLIAFSIMDTILLAMNWVGLVIWAIALFRTSGTVRDKIPTFVFILVQIVFNLFLWPVCAVGYILGCSKQKVENVQVPLQFVGAQGQLNNPASNMVVSGQPAPPYYPYCGTVTNVQ